MARQARERPEGGREAAARLDEDHVAAMVDFWNAGVPTLDYGNNIRQVAKEEGLENAFAFPGFVPAYIRPLFCRGIGPFRWCALSGDPEDIYKTDAKVKELFPDDAAPAQLARHGARAHRLSGPARAHLLGRARRPPPRSASPSTRWCEGRAEGAGRDRPRPSRFRLGRLAQPRDRGDEGRLGRGVGLAAAERAAQHRLGRDLGVAAPWRRRRHGLQPAFRHGDRAATAPRCRARLERVLWNDPATGVMRHADAGYDIALDCAREARPPKSSARPPTPVSTISTGASALRRSASPVRSHPFRG
jgi:urocanate hydratase